MLNAHNRTRKPSLQEPNPPAYTLPGVLHFLQQEWRRYERDRNEWEIERAELKARVTVLEGEHRGHEATKIDLMRRVKMLEHALRLERRERTSIHSQSKFQAETNTNSHSVKQDKKTNEGKPPTAAAAAATTTNSDGVSATKPSNGTTSNTDSPGTTSKNTETTYLASILKTRIASSTPKSRTKSRDILKLCLQEVDQLSSFCGEQLVNATTTAAAVSLPVTYDAPSPPPPPPPPLQVIQASDNKRRTGTRDAALMVEETSPTLPPADAQQPTVRLPRNSNNVLESAGGNSGPMPGNRRHKHHNNNPAAPDEHLAGQPIAGASAANINGSPKMRPVDGASAFAAGGDGASNRKRKTVFFPADMDAMEPERASEAPRSPSLVGVKVDEVDDEMMLNDSKPQGDPTGGHSETNTIVRKATGTAKTAERGKEEGVSSQVKDYFEFEDSDECSTLEGNDINGLRDTENGIKLWQQRIPLRSHLDTVRAIDFHQRDLVLATGSEDGLVKIWDLNALSPVPVKTKEYEPHTTFRAHLGAIHAVQISVPQSKCYSAGADAAVIVWKIPPSDADLYAPHDPEVLCAKFIGHSDIIWDLRLQPTHNDQQQQQLIASASADGTVKLWDICDEGSPLRTSFGYEGAEGGDEDLSRDIAPTSVSFCQHSPEKMAVSYRNAALRIFDVETGKLIVDCQSKEGYDGTPATQINYLAMHPIMNMVVAGYEDRHLRFFDLNTGQCTQAIVAHLGAISSLDIASDGNSLISGSHDCSVRLWDVRNFSCIQEFAAHRPKLDEGVCCVRYHPTLPWLATGGADSVVKVFS